MALDLNKFGRFEFDAKAVGTVACAPLSEAVISAVREQFPDVANADPATLARFLLSKMCAPKSSDDTDPALLTDEQLGQITAEDLNLFAERFVATNRWIFKSEPDKSKSEAPGASRPEDDDPKVYLRRGFDSYLQRLEKQRKKFAEQIERSMPKSLLSEDNLRLLRENDAISRALGDSLGSFALRDLHSPGFQEALKSIQFDIDALGGSAHFRRLHEQIKSMHLDADSLGSRASEFQKLRDQMESVKVDFSDLAKHAGASLRMQQEFDSLKNKWAELEKSVEPTRRMWEDLEKSLEPARRLQEQYKALDDAIQVPTLGSANADYMRAPGAPTQLELPAIPNPMLETNAKLEVVVAHLGSMAPVVADSASLIKNMNELGLGLVTSSAAHSERTAAQNTKMINWAVTGVVVSAIGIVVGAIFSALTYFGAAKEDVTANALRDLAGQLAGSQAALIAIQRSSEARQSALENELRLLRSKPTPKAKLKPAAQ